MGGDELVRQKLILNFPFTLCTLWSSDRLVDDFLILGYSSSSSSRDVKFHELNFRHLPRYPFCGGKRPSRLGLPRRFSGGIDRNVRHADTTWDHPPPNKQAGECELVMITSIYCYFFFFPPKWAAAPARRQPWPHP